MKLAFHEEGSGPPVVMIHGFGGSKAVWQTQIPDFSRRYRVIALDLPGHGDSPRPEGDGHYSPARCAVEVLDLMDRLGLREAVLLGQSMGTFVSQMLYLEHPQRVRALVLNGALAGSPPAGVQRGPWVDEIVKRIEARGIDAYMEELVPNFFSRSPDPALVRAATEQARKLAQHAALAYCRAVSGLNIREHLGEIRVPTLLIVGAEDGRTPVEESERMNRAIPDSWLKIVKGAGHLCNVEKPAEFNRAVLSFIDWVHEGKN
jgi:pimeloyl-ACP methyl ester carboxylesterase